ncbi:ABC transporter permease [Nocardioides nematodiphilus]|uniref:ABC transporter permease n=1 Tax=Nocardioides nematodiphilus TaxID=2849669 RepID=UPI001CDA1DE0|nr:ABC transporter permease [Nocardioides nematodiphilus]MCA1984570.1 ABC transporter permease [Nocardioides nematodiphilus]
MSHEIPVPVGVGLETEVAPTAITSKRRARSTARGPWAVYGVRTLLVAVWLGAWELSARTFMDPFLISMPSQIWQRLVTWFTDGTSQGSIWENIWVTLEEAAGGFVLGVLGGVVLGVVLGRARFAADVLAPFIKAANAIPRIVLASLFVIWFGLGMESKIATAFVLVFFAVFFNAFQGAREVDKTLIDNARILGAGRWSLMRTIVLPSATSWILASMHVAFGFALIGAVVGEVIGASRGMGLLIQQSQGNFDSAGVYAGMVVITAVALIAETLITRLEKRLTAWRPQATSTHASGV